MVKNVADENQIAEAERKARDSRKVQLSDIRFILDSKQGRRFIWRLLEEAKVFGSIWEQSAKIHYNAGKQDFGHYILGELTEARPEALLQMMQDAKKISEE